MAVLLIKKKGGPPAKNKKIGIYSFAASKTVNSYTGQGLMPLRRGAGDGVSPLLLQQEFKFFYGEFFFNCVRIIDNTVEDLLFFLLELKYFFFDRILDE